MRPGLRPGPTAETQPFALDTSPDSGLPATPTERPSAWWPGLLGLSALLALIAAWRLLPVLVDGAVGGAQRAALWQGLAAGAGCLAALALAVAWQWRRQRQAGQALRDTAHHLRRGAWESAVDILRRPARRQMPSAFADLAEQVEGVMGESDRRWRARAELSSDWFWETDEYGRLSSMSADAPIIKPAGRALGDVLGRRHDQLDFLQAPEGGWDAFHARMGRRETFRHVEVQVAGMAGRAHGWVALSGRPRWRRDGHFGGYEGVGSDVTEPKQAYQRLKDSEQRHAVMAGLSSDWYWSTDAQHRCPAPDAEQLRRFGSLAHRCTGQTLWEAYPDAISAPQWQSHREDLDARRPFRALEFPMRRDDGRIVWISLAGAPRHDEDGHFVGYHGVGRDISLRKAAESMLVKHNQELQHAVASRTRELQLANHDLDDFARHLAHELRTPIGEVQGLANLLTLKLGERLGTDDRQLLDLQRRAATTMLGTLEALLDLARSSTEGIERHEVDVSALTQRVIGELPPIERVAPVQWQVQPGLVAWASASQLRIVLHNLLGNAAKFTRHTERPWVRVDGGRDAAGLLTLAVEDNGAGFDEDLAERLFKPFQRLHRQDEYHGTGLGLTIVQRIVQRHGGRISATGRPGRGARFEFTLSQRHR
ncbi:ATP-binding protein [Ideonella sp. A 288]|uniref:sensor histidine kinase n=1 Tax=Ideonella sp. A 288 TaxID=1962181 RepID=UPI000B4B4C91|nr:ATP-binding protein [Ideonella sp. A 288]